MQTEVRRLELSGDGLRKLTPQGRYVFALAGHIFNELMLLQKWIHISRMPPGDPSPQQDAAVGISMFLLRMLAAKTHEALDVLKKQSVSDVLKADYFVNVDGLTAQWDATLDAYSNLQWLGRNTVALSEVCPTITAVATRRVVMTWRVRRRCWVRGHA